MPTSNTTLQRKAGFFHSLGLVITKDGNAPGNEIIKSAHNVSNKEGMEDHIVTRARHKAGENHRKEPRCKKPQIP